MAIEVDATGRHHTCTSHEGLPQGTHHPQQQLRDLLISITQVSEKLEAKKKEIRQQDVILQQLALASLLATQRYKPEKKIQKESSEDQPPFEFHVSVEQEKLSEKSVEFILVCRLYYQGPITLSKGWELGVSFVAGGTVGSSSESAEKSVGSRLSIRSVTVPLEGMCSRGFRVTKVNVRDLLLPLQKLEHCLPVLVTTVMFYRLPDTCESTSLRDKFVKPSETASPAAESQSCVVSVPFKTCEVDILDFLTPDHGDSREVFAHVLRSDSLEDILKKLASSSGGKRVDASPSVGYGLFTYTCTFVCMHVCIQFLLFSGMYTTCIYCSELFGRFSELTMCLTTAKMAY